MRAICLISAIVVGVAGCSGERIVNTGEAPPTTPAITSTAPPTPPPSNAHLVDAFDYVAHPDGQASYFFTTPSGSWACAIVPRVKAGCGSATGSGMSITGAPETVINALGEEATPNAVVVEREADARFVALEEPEFVLEPGPANVLPFNRILAAAGFRCNVQESGISCLSEKSGKGFTFAPEGFTPQYTDVPVNAP
jgi:hypothetical protein